MLLVRTRRETLLAPLQAVSGIVEKRHTLPILANVLLEKKGDLLTLLATDVEMQITTSSSGAAGDEDGAITVAARKLQEILRSLPEGIEISLVLDNRRLQLRAGKSRFNLQTLPAEDFPCMSLAEGESLNLRLTQRDLRHLLAQTQYAMANQDVRYYLNGLLLMIADGELRAVATDGHRLAYASVPVIDLPADARHELILPRKTVIELGRLLADSDEPAEVGVLDNQVCFRFASMNLVSKLIDGRFPDYQRVIPASLRNVVVVERNALLQSMIRAAILTNEKFRGVRLILNEGSLQIVAANTEQEEAEDEIEVDYHGEPLDVGFNVTYLLDVLNNTNADTVQWGFNDANSSALLTVSGNERFKYVVMPMRI
ncbi:DNA polymerase III subunit beta [Accumulibacter sp.]|uniref:DNA polymerase III subunit beta n=1 Tax=Accumulibacter sp. TaxID=2053492 RepID=UPI002C958091|nr:DNA polymerase III subunit beta [Accumulibacter sp.]HNH92949.1 DNA polymerase III subunit beta [Accumulibacter sp.]